jgi:hypothetical protein
MMNACQIHAGMEARATTAWINLLAIVMQVTLELLANKVYFSNLSVFYGMV